MSEFKLPEEVTEVKDPTTRDLIIISQPKMGKSAILADFTKKYNAIVFNLEKNGYEFLAAKKINIHESEETTLHDAFLNYVKIRNLLLENKGKYKYLLIDGTSDLDILSEVGGTKVYMKSIVGKKFNRKSDGTEYTYGDPEYKSVLTLPDGAGYAFTRKWFLDQVEMFRQIAPYRIYASHVGDKYIRENGKDEVVGSEISLTGKLKTIFASKVTALAKLVAEDNKRYLNFEVLNDSILAGSRNPKLTGKILISEKNKEGEIITFWNKIYN